MQKEKRGFFITFEGGEGCGKSTQAKLLYNKLLSKGFGVLLTREPGKTDFGEAIRKVILVEKAERSPETDLLLFETSRRNNTERMILPALRENKIIVSDRYYDSTTAYQGYGDGVSLDKIKQFNSFASCNIIPDLTFIIDIPFKKGLERTTHVDTGKADNMASKSLEFHKKVNQGYRKIARLNPKRCKIIPYADGCAETMHEDIYKILLGNDSFKMYIKNL